jgi:hypothetical protein
MLKSAEYIKAIINIHTERNSGLINARILEQNAVFDSIAGLIFMGTPQAGSGVETLVRVRILENIARVTFKKPPGRLTQALAAHSDEVLELSENFQKTTMFTRHEIEICSFYETKTTKSIGQEVRLVMRTSKPYVNIVKTKRLYPTR